MNGTPFADHHQQRMSGRCVAKMFGHVSFLSPARTLVVEQAHLSLDLFFTPANSRDCFRQQPVAKLWHRRLAGGFHGQEQRFRTAVFPFTTGCQTTVRFVPRSDMPVRFVLRHARSDGPPICESAKGGSPARENGQASCPITRPDWARWDSNPHVLTDRGF